MPDQALDEAEVAQKIASLAQPHHLAVLFLAVIESAMQEPAAYHRLANLSAMTGAFSIENETRLVIGGNWIREIQEVWQAGDQIICHAEQTIMDREMNQVPLNAALSIAMNAPVIVLTGLYTEKQPRQRTRLSELKWWSVALVFLIALGGMMFFVSQATSGWVESAFLFLTFLMIILMIWLWNKRG